MKNSFSYIFEHIEHRSNRSNTRTRLVQFVAPQPIFRGEGGGWASQVDTASSDCRRRRCRRLSISLDTLSRVQTDDCQGISRELAAARDSSSFRCSRFRTPPLPWSSFCPPSLTLPPDPTLSTRRRRNRRGRRASLFSNKSVDRGGKVCVCVYACVRATRLGDFGVSNFRRRHPSRHRPPPPPLPAPLTLSINSLSPASSFCGGHLWLWDEGRMCNELLV